MVRRGCITAEAVFILFQWLGPELCRGDNGIQYWCLRSGYDEVEFSVGTFDRSDEKGVVAIVTVMNRFDDFIAPASNVWKIRKRAARRFLAEAVRADAGIGRNQEINLIENF
jgi:hypothetical protein